MIAEQHLALTETFNSPWHFPQAPHPPQDQEAVGEIFLRCNAKDIVDDCGKTMQELIKRAHGSHVQIPEIKIYGHLDATVPYILSHLEYIIGELLRNSIQAVIERRRSKEATLPPIAVLICETAQHVIIRISDQGGGIPNEILPSLWSFSKGPRREKRLENLARVPKLLGTLQELQVPGEESAAQLQQRMDRRSKHGDSGMHTGSLSSLTGRAPDSRLGIGLPMSRLYAGTIMHFTNMALSNNARRVLGWKPRNTQSGRLWLRRFPANLQTRQQKRATDYARFHGRHIAGAFPHDLLAVAASTCACLWPSQRVCPCASTTLMFSSDTLLHHIT